MIPISELPGDEASDGRSRTFVIENEDHTLGNSLIWIIQQYPEVEFCSYVIPHPAERKLQIRIQMRQGKGLAVDTLKRGLKDLMKVCDHVEEEYTKSCHDHSIPVQ